MRRKNTASVVHCRDRDTTCCTTVATALYMGPMFRRRRPQRGRYASSPVGASAGVYRPEVDAELILLATGALEELGLVTGV
jgi:histidyl-tRNA synthetase